MGALEGAVLAQDRRVKFPKPLFVTATRYEWEYLDFVRHRGGHANGGANNRRTARPFAEPRDEIVLNIDAAQMGLGNGCLGPRPLASYMLVTRPESFSYVMRPCISGAASLALLARSGAPVEVPKPPRKLRRFPQGELVASGEFTSEQGGDEIRVEFAKPANGRYLKLECLGEWRGRAYCAIAELSALVE